MDLLKRFTVFLALFSLFLICVLNFQLKKTKYKFAQKLGLDASPTRTSADVTHAAKSAYEIKGFSGLRIMKPLTTPRELFNYTLWPWKFSVNSSNVNNLTNQWSVMVMVKSHSAHKEVRRDVRDTWGSIKYLNGVRMERTFIVGLGKSPAEDMDLVKENKEHGDLLQIERKEVYGEIAYKTLAGSQWVSQNLPPHWLYTSADDDMMPNLAVFVEKMEKMMKEELSKRNLNCSAMCIGSISEPEILSSLPMQCGYRLYKDRSPIRGSSKWQATPSLYELNIYPTFCGGGWYTLPVKLSSALYQTSRYCSFFYLEDVWISGLIRIKYFRDREDETAGLLVTDYGYAKHLGGNLKVHWKNLNRNLFNKNNVVVVR